MYTSSVRGRAGSVTRSSHNIQLSESFESCIFLLQMGQPRPLFQLFLSYLSTEQKNQVAREILTQIVGVESKDVRQSYSVIRR